MKINVEIAIKAADNPPRLRHPPNKSRDPPSEQFNPLRPFNHNSLAFKYF
jgi:hypothetical protein